MKLDPTAKKLLIAAGFLLTATSVSLAQSYQRHYYGYRPNAHYGSGYYDYSPSFRNSFGYGSGPYDYSPSFGNNYDGPPNYSGYPSGQPGPSSGIEAIR